MTNPDVKNLTRGAVFFLEHALVLLSDRARRAHAADPFAEPVEVGLARVGAVLKLASGALSDLLPEEREALSDALRVAADLAAAARVDPRWERLGLAGDPVRDLRELRHEVLRSGLLDDIFFSTAA